MSKIAEGQKWPCLYRLPRAAMWLLGCVLLMPAPALGACSFSTFTSIVFGNYDIFSTAPLDTTGAVVYRCAQTDHNITITLDAGGASSFGARRMLNGTEQLNFNLYLDAARTVVWGDGSGGSQSFFIHNPPNSSDSSIPVYGRIPAGQNVPTGEYSNDIIVTMIF